MDRLVDGPQLSARFDVLPPRGLVIDGVPRRRNREISPEEAVRFSGRGLPTYRVSSGFGTAASGEQLAGVVGAYRSHFDGMGPGHPPEASAHVYGRRDPRAREDTRIVVVCVVDLDVGRL